MPCTQLLILNERSTIAEEGGSENTRYDTFYNTLQCSTPIVDHHKKGRQALQNAVKTPWPDMCATSVRMQFSIFAVDLPWNWRSWCRAAWATNKRVWPSRNVMRLASLSFGINGSNKSAKMCMSDGMVFNAIPVSDKWPLLEQGWELFSKTHKVWRMQVAQKK